MLPKSCVDVLLYVIDKLPAPLTVAAVIPLPVLPAGPVGPVGPCGPVAPRPDKFSVVPSYVKSLPESAIEFESIDVNTTGKAVGVGSTGHLFLYNQTNQASKPENVLEG